MRRKRKVTVKVTNGKRALRSQPSIKGPLTGEITKLSWKNNPPQLDVTGWFKPEAMPTRVEGTMTFKTWVPWKDT